MSLRLSGLIATSTLAISCSEQLKPVPPLNPKAAVTDAADDTEKTSASAETTKPGMLTSMRIGDLYQLTQSNAALIYDVRPKLIYALGHIPQAISWPKNNYKKDLDKHEPNISAASKSNKPVVIYCTDLACPDAKIVAKALSERGHNISILQGGYEAWKAAIE